MENPNCPCKTASCPRHGHCDQCVSYHGTYAKSTFTSCGKDALALKSVTPEADEASTTNKL